MTRIHSSIQKIPNPCWKLFTIDRIPAAIKYSGVVVWLILFCLSVDSGAVEQWPQDQCLVINCESECWQHWPHSLSVSSLQWTRDTRASSLPDCEQQIIMNTSVIFHEYEVLKSSWCPKSILMELDRHYPLKIVKIIHDLVFFNLIDPIKISSWHNLVIYTYTWHHIQQKIYPDISTNISPIHVTSNKFIILI